MLKHAGSEVKEGQRLKDHEIQNFSGPGYRRMTFLRQQRSSFYICLQSVYICLLEFVGFSILYIISSLLSLCCLSMSQLPWYQIRRTFLLDPKSYKFYGVVS